MESFPGKADQGLTVAQTIRRLAVLISMECRYVSRIVI